MFGGAGRSLFAAFLLAGPLCAAESLPRGAPVAIRITAAEVSSECLIPQVLMLEQGVPAPEGVRAGLFLRVAWNKGPGEIEKVLRNAPAQAVACGLVLPSEIRGEEAAKALADFRAAAKRSRPSMMTAAVLSDPFQVESAPAVDLVQLKPPQGNRPPAAGTDLYGYYLANTCHRTLIAQGALTAAEVLRGAGWGKVPDSRDAERRLALLRGLRARHDAFAFDREQETPRTLFLIPEGLSSGPAWRLGQADGWFRAAMDAGLALRVLRVSDISPRDIERYRLVLVPLTGEIGEEAARSLAKAAAAGGTVVLGGAPRGAGADVLLQLAGLQAPEPVCRYEEKTSPAGALGAFRETSLKLPQTGSEGLGRLWSGVSAGQAEVFLGRPETPCVTVRSISRGWTIMMNLDMLEYERTNRAGLSGARQVRDMLRHCACRARAGLPLGMRDGWRAWWISGGEWYHLALAEVPPTAGTVRPADAIVGPLQHSAGMTAMVHSAGAGTDGAAAVGWFRRRLEHLRCEAHRSDGAVVFEVDAGGIGPEMHVPLLVEISGSDGRGALLRFVIAGAKDNRIDLPEELRAGPLRVLVQEPFSGFRALAEIL
ncbi:MAG: hypothetical protein JW909_13465 [Planctomycetes bacterium]|nr:hypothetical protein [Planctomycetota bacterium]